MTEQISSNTKIDHCGLSINIITDNRGLRAVYIEESNGKIIYETRNRADFNKLVTIINKGHVVLNTVMDELDVSD